MIEEQERTDPRAMSIEGKQRTDRKAVADPVPRGALRKPKIDFIAAWSPSRSRASEV